MLSGLYYPFSRCIDACTLKQLLLVFDSLTFIEPVDDDQWRAKLFRDLETVEDPRFRAYRDLERDLATLKAQGAMVLKRPSELAAFESPETAASALSDLADPVWRDVASKPARFGLPHQQRARDRSATWQVFPNKLPPGLRATLLSDPAFQRHLVWHGGDCDAWTLTYEAGSAAALNLHLAAAGELGLAPVTDSAMHHRLLLRKVTRSITPESEWTEQSTPSVDAAVNSTAVQLVDRLLPRSALGKASFDSILRFRETTRDTRAAMVEELKSRLTSIVKMRTLREILSHEQQVADLIVKETRDYRASLEYARDRLWPGLVKSSITAVSSGSAAALGLSFLVGGPMAVVAGSIGGVSLGILQAALEQRAEARKVQRAASSSATYLSQLVDL